MIQIKKLKFILFYIFVAEVDQSRANFRRNVKVMVGLKRWLCLISYNSS